MLREQEQAQLTKLVEGRPSSNHHRLLSINSEQAKDDVVEPCAEDTRPSFDVTASKRTLSRLTKILQNVTHMPHPWSPSGPLR